MSSASRHRHHLLSFLLLAAAASSALSTTHPADLSALSAFKSAVFPASIPPWSCLASWNFSSDPCHPATRIHFICGLTCSASSPARVIALVLDPAGYSGPISPALAGLSALAHLDLSDNSFRGPLPAALFSLPALLSLSLRSNSLSGPLPAAVSALKSLQSLDLSRNALTGSVPPSISVLPELTTLDLSFNRLFGAVPPLPPRLLELALRDNALSGPLTSSAFHSAPELEVVELAGNRLSGELGPWFFTHPAIQQADLSNNSLTSISVPPSSASQLVALDLSFNQISGSLPETLATYPLLSLSLRYNKLHGGIPKELGKKGSLRRLFLDGNFLNGKVPAELTAGVAGDLADNCLESCPTSLCSAGQKPQSVCRQAYRKRPLFS